MHSSQLTHRESFEIEMFKDILKHQTFVNYHMSDMSFPCLRPGGTVLLSTLDP
ncbi:hypothetical protein GCM10025794_37020 [Massilia kyonggiensis]